MARGKPWLREELIIAMNLYYKLPFGKLDQRTSIIIEVAQKLGRTPSSLAMKLTNLASLDPTLQARGIKGLLGASKADKLIWEEFHENWENLGYESEEKFQLLFDNSPPEIELIQTRIASKKIRVAPPIDLTESEATVKTRRGQSFFRQSVLANYDGRCCITGNPISELLVASHIVPWSENQEHRLDPCNGICLSRTQDAAFDKGLITIDENYQLVLSSYLQDFLPEKTLEENFINYCGKQIRLPERFQPKLEFLWYHREEIFIG
jgi:putative restriction endonuclease